MGTPKPRAPAKQAAPTSQPLPEKTFVIDNGAYTLKAGYAPSTFDAAKDDEILSSCVTIPNALAKTRDGRVFVGPQLSTHISDWNEALFRRPVEKGFIVNWEAQKEIWEYSFFDEKLVRTDKTKVPNPGDTTLILTEAPNALPILQKHADEMVMEEWGFGGYARVIGRLLKIWARGSSDIGGCS